MIKTLIPFKNRKVDCSKPVEMYRCLNRKGFIFSIRQGGKVVGHTSDIILKDCEFIIQEAGKTRCINSKQRNVHAFVKGYIGGGGDIKFAFSFELKYNPYEDRGFYCEFGNLNRASIVYFDNENKRLLFQV